MAYRNTGPEVYDYNRDSYDPYHNHHPSNPPQHYSQETHHHTTPVYDEKAPVHSTTHQTAVNHSDFRGSQASRRGSKYDQYRHRVSEYKYNLFSMIDEPWNRCCEVGKCGNCPGNECIARREPKKDWL